jgi:hypothetical protein
MSNPHKIRSVDKSETSRIVERFAPQIALAAKGFPILDVACGSGRNADIFVSLGCNVICLDMDLSRLEARYHPAPVPSQIQPLRIDLLNDAWPMRVSSIGGIINIHCLLPSLFPSFVESLIPGGYLVLETVPGHGGNYVQLPKSGQLRSDLSQSFDFEFYKERAAGPSVIQAVTVRLVGKRKSEIGGTTN